MLIVVWPNPPMTSDFDVDDFAVAVGDVAVAVDVVARGIVDAAHAVAVVDAWYWMMSIVQPVGPANVMGKSWRYWDLIRCFLRPGCVANFFARSYLSLQNVKTAENNRDQHRDLYHEVGRADSHIPAASHFQAVTMARQSVLASDCCVVV